MSRSPQERIDWFKSHLPEAVGMCLRHVWQATAVPYQGISDANAGVRYVRNAGHMHHGDTPPKGAWLWWTSPTHGHVALSAGHGMIWSTDVNGPRTVGLVNDHYPQDHWGHTYAGWSDWYGELFEVGEEDMPLTKEDVDRIAAAVWAYELENTTTDPRKKQPARWFLNRLLEKLKG